VHSCVGAVDGERDVVEWRLLGRRKIVCDNDMMIEEMLFYL
jgi:hypothetical protein